MIPPGWHLVIANRQRARRLNPKLIKEIAGWVLSEELPIQHVELGIHFVTAKEMARLHQDFMNIAGSTDVITFDHGSQPGLIHGEIFISVEDAIAQAEEFKTTWPSEVTRYVIHGILHLIGHDDLQPAARTKMKRAENLLLRIVSRKFRLSTLEKK